MNHLDRDLVLARYDQHVSSSLANIARMVSTPVETHAEGAHVHGSDGRTYLDCGGFGVFLLGHRHPKVVEAVHRQLDRNPLATRLFLNPELADAAAELASVSPAGLDKVFLTNSGAEATEVGIKLARLAGKGRVVATTGGFHGKTTGALSVTGRPQYRDPFGPLLPGVEFVAFGDLAALEAVIGPDTVVILEPVQAEGGVRVPPPGYLRAVRDLCTTRGALLVLDEIQTGLGRLGTWWGADREGVSPDVLLTGKILGGGVMPVGGVVATAEVFAPLDADPLLHSSTFAGSPLASAAVSATIGVLREEGLVERTAELGPHVLEMTRAAMEQHCPHLVTETRGEGLLVGVDLVTAEAATELLIALLDEGVIPSYSLNSSNVLRLTPPAVLTTDDLHRLESALDRAAATLGRTLRAAA
ncbi:aspartate aminotransferase family protein [Nocardioides marmoribigeumensis]|uniref:Putrescine aminotransferase n=1 Tax=Nocardioides marmoribigeumensis TaxID=433649 RepID=A0ABU2BSC8_9ACTN|nr:aminotransferase class III-fold pyridoxal phosphate-dependent enzyme [Nocardioides marmoribigeumensis]MDR7360628.1 putrescine aminotransferase [Nocardioides marmoribigeumensis]